MSARLARNADGSPICPRILTSVLISERAARGAGPFRLGAVATAAIPALVLLLAGSSFAAEVPAPANIVVILADDLGFSDLGSYGGEIETPNLDRLARRGVRFTQFYVTPRCSPTRAALLTGLYPHEVGIGHLNEQWGRPGYRGELAPDAATLAEVLSSVGYGTYMAGKWHLAHNPELDGTRPSSEERRSWPRERGFDRFFGTIRGSGSFFEPASLVRDDVFVEPGEDFYYTDAISSEAAAYLDQHFAEDPSRPFFLYLSYTAPHWPLHAPDEDLRRVAGRYDAGWDALREQRYRRMVEMGMVRRDWSPAPRDPRAEAWHDTRHQAWQARRMEAYAAMVERMDRGIGRVLAALERQRALDDTLVVFLSDNGGNGEQLRGLWRLGALTMPIPAVNRRRFGDNPSMMPGPADTFQTCGPGWSSLQDTPFRLGKHATHEGGIASPLIVHWPAGLGVEPGSLIRAPGHVVDLMPTLLEVAGTVYPRASLSGADMGRAGGEVRALRGESLMPLLRGGSRRRGPMFWEHEGNRAVRDGKWKLVSDWPGDWQLYDLETDRTELHDLAARHARRVAAMAAMYERFAADTGVEAWPWVSRPHRWLFLGTLFVILVIAAIAVIRRRLRNVTSGGRPVLPFSPLVPSADLSPADRREET